MSLLWGIGLVGLMKLVWSSRDDLRTGVCCVLPITHKPEARPKTQKLTETGLEFLVGVIGSEALGGSPWGLQGPSDQ